MCSSLGTHAPILSAAKELRISHLHLTGIIDYHKLNYHRSFESCLTIYRVIEACLYFFSPHCNAQVYLLIYLYIHKTHQDQRKSTLIIYLFCSFIYLYIHNHNTECSLFWRRGCVIVYASSAKKLSYTISRLLKF